MSFKKFELINPDSIGSPEIGHVYLGRDEIGLWEKYSNGEWVYIITGSTTGAGTSGSSGVNGIDGEFLGSSGSSGKDGINGSSGRDGSSGRSGTHGTSGIGSSGTSGWSGSAGTSGIGSAGTSGISGSSGLTGTSGSSGVDGNFYGSSGSSGYSGGYGGSTRKWISTTNSINSSVSGRFYVSGIGGLSNLDYININRVDADSNHLQDWLNIWNKGIIKIEKREDLSNFGIFYNIGYTIIGNYYHFENFEFKVGYGSITDNEEYLISFIPSGDGSSGTSGTSGLTGTSGTSGNPGTSGKNGSSGTSGSGTPGTSGTSGSSGKTGSSGTSGSGTPGTSGTSGSGTPGTSGTSGSSGKTGSSGTSGSGTPGTSGTSGSSGKTGSSGTSGSGTPGTSGTSGSSGKTGSSGTSGSGTPGTSGTSGSGTPGTSGTSGSSGKTGSSGTSGSGTPGTSGTSGTSGSSGNSGTSGTGGTSGSGTPGTSGSSGESLSISGSEGNILYSDGIGGIGNRNELSFELSTSTLKSENLSVSTSVQFRNIMNGYLYADGDGYVSSTSGGSGSGSSGTSGLSYGTSGTSGRTGSSGTSGLTGSSGTSGKSGTSGLTGTSGTSGETNGTSGSSGSSGISGDNYGAWRLNVDGTGLVNIHGTSSTSIYNRLDINAGDNITLDAESGLNNNIIITISSTSGGGSGSSGTSGSSGFNYEAWSLGYPVDEVPTYVDIKSKNDAGATYNRVRFIPGTNVSISGSNEGNKTLALTFSAASGTGGSGSSGTSGTSGKNGSSGISGSNGSSGTSTFVDNAFWRLDSGVTFSTSIPIELFTVGPGKYLFSYNVTVSGATENGTLIEFYASNYTDPIDGSYFLSSMIQFTGTYDNYIGTLSGSRIVEFPSSSTIYLTGEPGDMNVKLIHRLFFSLSTSGGSATNASVVRIE